MRSSGKARRGSTLAVLDREANTQSGCSAGRIQRDFHHGLLGSPLPRTDGQIDSAGSGQERPKPVAQSLLFLPHRDRGGDALEGPSGRLGLLEEKLRVETENDGPEQRDTERESHGWTDDDR